MKKLIFCYVMEAHIEQRKKEIAFIDFVCDALDAIPYIILFYSTIQQKQQQQ